MQQNYLDLNYKDSWGIESKKEGDGGGDETKNK